MSPAASTEANIAVVSRFVDEVVNGGNLDAIDELWAGDMVWRGGSLGEYHGIDAYKSFMAANAAGAFTGMRLDVLQVVAQGDTAVLLFTNSGTHTGDFMGTAPTGKHARWLGVGVYRIKNHKIAEATFAEDILGLLLQLGLTTLPSAG
ncbi:ester cyclase [Marinitenerispora sediminis]|uniref:Ester cyclase n=1 Tax=Marinitenerispora sediminis TaxID=1931232 RepID=A0A368TA98_9ACTN|nr:ester cyclase [Marinitenerispora sediminis]RCV53396.1 ester cyclase [Marinitenerispora sediminis]RCV58408.1 ester cyclase [Marinitenerispora sediminis]RCV61811.1 ester cyclase [Marinitenerispora sediminis]